MMNFRSILANISCVGYVAAVILIVWKLCLTIMKWTATRNTPIRLDTDEDEYLSAYRDIIPLPDFDWESTEPIKQRPFKAKYHLTMAVASTTFSELLEMDKTYLSHLDLRKQIMKENPEIVLQAAPEAVPAVNELYTWLTSTYLPMRFPSMFTLQGTRLINNVTSQWLPLTPPTDSIEALKTLGRNIDEDFLILLPSDDGDGYTLKAYVVCFPSGFNTLEKFSMKLRDIHRPVPGYKEKIELSMDRFFARLPVGKVVKRANWAITTHSRLFVPSGNHLYEGDDAVEEKVDPVECRLRSERQLLWRLPETRAIVFNFKTYLYSLDEIKEDGLAGDLADAIDGLREGSVPEMHFYKKGVVWGDAVKAYLRS